MGATVPMDNEQMNLQSAGESNPQGGGMPGKPGSDGPMS